MMHPHIRFSLTTVVRTCVILAGSLVISESALAVSAPPAPVTKTCPNGSVIPIAQTCPPITATEQSGVTTQTLTGLMTSIGGIIGNVLGGVSGGGSGGNATAPGVNRVALNGETGAAAAAGNTRWNAWLAYAQANIGYSFQPLQTSGDQKIVLGGIDYSFANNVTLGVAVSDERLRATTSYNGGSINGSGNTIAPYLGWRINQNWAVDATLAWGTTNINIVDNSIAGGTTGANKDKRSLVSGGIAYNQPIGQWLLTGKGTLLTAEDKFSSFTTSRNQFINATSTRTSQARLLGQAMYNAGSFVPFVGVTYIYDLERPFQNPVGGQSAANDRDGWQVRAGVNFRSSGALYGGVQFSSEIGRSQVKNDQVLFSAGMRF